MSKKTFLVLSLIMAAVVRADVMNLNEFVPTHLEDATPVEKHATLLQVSSVFAKQDQDDVIWRPDVRHGLSDRIQLEALADLLTGGRENQSGKVSASVLYVLNKSDSAVPVFSINPVVHLPTGKRSRGVDPGVKLLVTSTLKGTMKEPETQLHLNYQFLHNADRRNGERADEVVLAFGFSRKIRHQMALIVDYFYQEDVLRERSEAFVETGLHQKLGKQFYLGYGLGKGVNPSSPDWVGLLSVEVEI